MYENETLRYEDENERQMPKFDEDFLQVQAPRDVDDWDDDDDDWDDNDDWDDDDDDD